MSRMFLVWSFLFGLALVAPIDTSSTGAAHPASRLRLPTRRGW